jgi:predicted ATPase/transcriptional regulator with XRE-family HTH domain
MSTERLFSQWLKQCRKALDLTQRDLAQRVGCAVVTIQKIEEGERRPSKQIAELLADHLEIPPESRTEFVRLARQTNASHQQSPLSAPATLLAPPSGFPTNLPAPLTPLIGRTTEFATICALLARSDVRLVTLVGPPGVGKSRLSIAVGEWATQRRDETPGSLNHTAGQAWLPHFADGVWFVPLAAVRDPALVVSTIAHTLGIVEAGAEPILQTLQLHLRYKTMLLVLDNFEQIVAVAPQLVELLNGCPEVKALVSSRSQLLVRGEHEVTLAPFDLPDPTKVLPTPGKLRDYPALALFEARVQSFQPAFALSEENARTVIEICARLDGLPLAIELAAARLRQFSLAQLAEHLQRPQAGSLNLLTGGPRDLPARHQTLRAAIAWSYEMLGPAAQQLFARLSIFSGGFDYPAAAAVAAPAHANKNQRRHSFLADFQALLDHSLIQKRDDGGETRFTMLETLRAFAAEQLQMAGAARAAAAEHARYFLALAETAARQFQDEQPKIWLDKIERDHDNIRIALKWLIAHDGAAAVRLAAALREFWYIRGYFSEGRSWLAQVLALESAPSPARAGALLAAGQLAQNQGEYAIAQEMLAESIALFRQLDDLGGCAEALRELGWILYNMHKREEAIARFEESLSLLRTSGDQAKIATVLVSLVHVMGLQTTGQTLVRSYLQESLAIFRRLNRGEDVAFALSRQSELETMLGDYAAAIDSLTEALTLLRGLGAKRGIAWALEALGDVERLNGSWAPARTHLSEALALFHELGDRDGVMITLHHLAQLERVEGKLDEALHGYRQSLALCQTLDNKHMIARCLAGLGGVALAQGQGRLAAQLLAAASAIFATLPPFLPPGDQTEYNQMIHATQRSLNAEDFAHAWGAGAALTTQQAVAFALSLAPSAA